MQHAGPGRRIPEVERGDRQQHPGGPSGHRRRHRRRGRVSVLGGGRLHHRPGARRQRRSGDVTADVHRGRFAMTRRGPSRLRVLDRALSRIGHRPNLVQRLDVRRVLRTRTRSGLQTRLAQRRPRRGTPRASAAMSPRRSRSPAPRSILVKGARRTAFAPSTTSAATAETSWCGTTFPTQATRGTCRRVHLQVPRVALRPRRCTDIRAAADRSSSTSTWPTTD